MEMKKKPHQYSITTPNGQEVFNYESLKSETI